MAPASILSGTEIRLIARVSNSERQICCCCCPTKKLERDEQQVCQCQRERRMEISEGRRGKAEGVGWDASPSHKHTQCSGWPRVASTTPLNSIALLLHLVSCWHHGGAVSAFFAAKRLTTSSPSKPRRRGGEEARRRGGEEARRRGGEEARRRGLLLRSSSAIRTRTTRICAQPCDRSATLREAPSARRRQTL